MSNKQNEPTVAQVLAGLITRSVDFSESTTSVQRSHRFPLHMYIHIENMAKMAGVSVSVIINQLLEAGMEAVWEELPEDVIRELSKLRQEQVNRPTKTTKVVVKNLAKKNKAQSKK